MTRKTFFMFIFTDNDFSLDAFIAGNCLSVTLRRFSLPSLLVLPTPIQTGCLWERHLFLELAIVIFLSSYSATEIKVVTDCLSSLFLKLNVEM